MAELALKFVAEDPPDTSFVAHVDLLKLQDLVKLDAELHNINKEVLLVAKLSNVSTVELP